VVKVKGRKIIIYLTLVCLIGNIVSGVSIVKNNENKEEPITLSTLGITTLYPPWYGHDSWSNEWKEIFGTADADVETNPNSGVMDLFVTTRFFGKGHADAHFQHQTSYNEFIAPKTGKYNIKFTYSYNGLIQVYLMRWGGRWDSWLDAEIKVTFIIHEKDATNAYVDKKTILYEEYRGTYLKDPTKLKDTFTFDFANIDLTGGKGVCFTAKIDAFLFIRSGGFCGRVHGKLDLIGSLDKIEIEHIDNYDVLPEIKIVKPVKNGVYIDDVFQGFANTTLIIGCIEIITEASDDVGVDRVEFYINDELRRTITKNDNGEYSWIWDDYQSTYRPFNIKVIAYDTSGLYNSTNLWVIYRNNNGEPDSLNI
jgi:hypothetical protein